MDGNTSADSLRALIQASEDGEFWDVSMIDPPAPLSGEWADGYSLAQLVADCGIAECGELDTTDGLTVLPTDKYDSTVDTLATAYEDAYWQAFEDEAVRSARAMWPDDDEGETR